VNPGTDYAVPIGTEVHSVASGVIAAASDNPAGSGGKYITVWHDDGSSADYLHLSGVSVAVNQWVPQGYRIGYSGNTGTPVGGGVYGPHLHISFRFVHSIGLWNNKNVDFDSLMNSWGAAGSGGTPIPNRRKDYGMGTLYQATSDGTKLVVKGFYYLMGEDGVLDCLGAAGAGTRAQDYLYAHPDVIPVGNAGTDLENKIAAFGLWEYTTASQSNVPWALTGRLIGRNASLDQSAPAGTLDRNYPRVRTA
jgi:murein DD-endopeptidase MepM/ murein hydrolase activator NlpD